MYITNKIQILVSNYVGIIHVCGMIIENIYGFIPNFFISNIHFFDKMYIMSFVFIPLSWIMCKDECIISYVCKKVENPHYQLGSEPENVKDIIDLFYTKELYSIFHHTNHILRISSIIIVNNRTTHISYYIFTPTLVLYTIYVYNIVYKLNCRKQLYPYFQILLCIYLFIIMLYIFVYSNSMIFMIE